MSNITNTGQSVIDSTISIALPQFTYSKVEIDSKISNSGGALNIMNDRKPLTGNLNFGSDYYVTTNKDPISDIHIVNKRYADNLALESGAIKNQIRGINSTVICTPGNADILINEQNKIKIDSDSIDFSQRAQYVGNVSVNGDTMLVPKIYVDSRDQQILSDATDEINDLATELRDTDANLQLLIETQQARITGVDNDLQGYKTTANNTFMKKIADSNLNLGQTHRIINLPPTVEPYDAISYFESNLRYMPKTTTLDQIPKPVQNIDLNGVKIRGSGTLNLGDIGMPGVVNDTLTTIDWVENRASVYRDQANTYSDGRLQSQFFTLDGKISLLDSKKVNYTQGIDVMGIPLLDYNMGQKKLFNLSDGVDSRDSINKRQLDAVSTSVTDGLALKADKLTTYSKTDTDGLLNTKYDFTNGVANTFNISELQNNKADKSTTYTKTEVDNSLNLKLNLSGGTMTNNLNMGGNRLIQTYNPQVNHDVVNKEHLDAQLLLKTNTSTTDALNTRVTNVENSSSLNATNIQTVSNNLSANYYNKTNIDASLNNKADKTQVNTIQSDLVSLSGSLSTTNNNLSTNYNTKTQDLALYKQLNTFDSKIQNTGTQSAIDCSGNNRIDIKVNNNNRGYFYQPTGQSTTPLGLLSNDKLQLQSELSSISVYGSKSLNDPLNTHGLYVGGIDDAAKNVQSTVNISQGNAQVYLTAGHVNPGAGMVDFCALSANKSLQISGGLQPGILDKQIVLYAASQNQSIPIQVDGKMGYSSAITIDQPNQFTSKSYVDAQVLSGGISQANADLRYYRNNVTLNNIVVPSGSLSMNSQKITSLLNGTSPQDAVSLSQVQSLISSGQSGSSISTANGYGIFTGLNDIQKKLNNSTYATESQFFGVYDEIYSNNINRRQYRMASQGVVNYIHAQYLVANGAGRTLISLSDNGSEGTQCARLSVYQRNSSNTDHENENYLQFKPLQNKIEVSVPISMITEPTYTGLNLVTKNYVDTSISAITTQNQNKIQSTSGTQFPMIVQCNNNQVSIARTSGIPDQLQLTGNTISQISGNSLQLNRGQVAVTLTDDGTTQNIGCNSPVIYSSQYSSATIDQLISQRIGDGRYMKKSADSNLVMNNNKVTGLSDASSSGDAVHFGQMLQLLRSLGFRRSGSISIYLGDLPLGNNFTIPAGNITSDNGFGSISAIHRVTGQSANYLEIRIVHNWNTNLIRLLTQIYSVGNTNLTSLNDNGFGQWITNFSNFSTNEILFWLVYEPNVNDPSIQANGYTILLQEYV